MIFILQGTTGTYTVIFDAMPTILSMLTMLRRKHKLIIVMRHPRSKRQRKPTYPEETQGSRIAAAVRKEASKLSSEQRRELFKRAMVRIYGGNPKETTILGH